MSTLIIEKKSLKTWLHTDSVLGSFIISKFYFNADNVSFQIVEQGQSKRVIYNISDITLFNIGGSAETFTTITDLSLRLEELKYPAFYIDGSFNSITGLIEQGTNVTITGTGTLADPYVISATGSGGIPEAPIDGELYGRKDAGWEVVPSGGAFVQEINGAIHRADVVDTGGGVNSTNLTDSSSSATGDYSHADSSGTANGVNSHADSGSTANGVNSHADSGSTANGYGSHADSSGYANGDYSNAHSSGFANGYYSNASGIDAIANSYSETAIGTYNEDVTPQSATTFNVLDLIFSIGIGTSGITRLTSFSAYKNGGFKFISRALSNITNAVKGFFAFDENGRPNAHNGTQWNALAYLSDITSGASWGAITGTLSSQTDLQNALNAKVDENAPITPDTKTKITYDAKGLVTGGDGLAESDIPTLPQSKITNLETDLTSKQDTLFTFNKKGLQFLEHFLGDGNGGGISQGSGIITFSSGAGSGSAPNISNAYPNRTNQQGVLRMATGTTATGFGRFILGANNVPTFFFGNGDFKFETWVNIETLSNATDRFYNVFGFGTNVTNNPANAVSFVYDEGGTQYGTSPTASANWKCYTRNSGGFTWTNTSVPVTASQWYKLTIIVNATGTSVTYYIDNVAVATHTTVPTNATVIGLHAKTVGTTSRNAWVDYIALEQTYTTPNL